MKLFTKCFLVLFLLTGLSLQAADKSIAIGVGVGLTRAVNESKPGDRALGPLFGIYGLFNNGIAEGFTPEIAITYYTNGTSEESDYFHYKSTMITPELRLRYEFTKNTQWTPYALVGVGAMFFKVDELDEDTINTAATGKGGSGTTMSIPLALGLKYDLNTTTSFDFNFGYNFSMTDDLNPIYDDVKDGNWFTRLGVHFNVYTFVKDDDGDGLTNDEEAKIGTDPKNPDTDNDGLIDGEEVNVTKSNPLDPDTDKGGIKDGVEVRNEANPLDADDDIMNISLNEKLVLNGIEFVTGKSEITPKSERILNNALKAMQKMSGTEFEIVGHTDNVGDINMNIQLSKERAESVKTWLVTRGISADRLKTRGAGPNEPIAPNTSDENKQKNRRVEFVRTK